MRILRRLLTVAALLALGAAGALWLARQELARPSAQASMVLVKVQAGESLRAVLGDLERQGALRLPRLAELYARYQDRGKAHAQVGSYEIAAHSTPLQILEQLRDGRIVMHQFTIIEGWSFAQLRSALSADASIDHAWRSYTDTQLMAALGATGQHPEGQFFPDSYRFAPGTADSRVYQLAFERMRSELAGAWRGRAPNLPIKSAQELLTLASIVEKETGREDERTRVAAVFANRLRIGMKLQTDPTVIYGLGAGYDGDLRSRDLASDTPYNTYTRYGLPPTPIALPGAASLRAAAQPADSPALYFVATGNGDGSHHYSASLAEHNTAVKRFLARTRGKRR
jgi:UPF0755 protein